MQMYETGEVTACITPRDAGGLSEVRVYRDSEQIYEKENGESANESIKLSLASSDQWQTLQIYLCDLSGNEYWSEEIPFYIGENVKHVPEYQKIRESAREIEEQKLYEKRNGGKEAGTAKAAKDSYGILTGTAAEDEESKTVLPIKTEEWILLILGLLAVVSTTGACFLGALRRK